ncbi:MAG: elongation factor P [Chloroflexi bacterium]|nr:elongation factor P [Chloroflexota bacterium]
MVMEFGDLRRGATIDVDGVPFKVEEYHQQKMQQRAPVYHIKMRNLLTGQLLDKTYSGYGIKLQRAPVENRDCTFLYEEDDRYNFMDASTFDQYELDKAVVGEAVSYLVDQTECQVVFFGEKAIAVELPITVDLVVADTPPGYKGDTASGSGKPATLETGIVLTVPMFVAPGDKVRVDTRTGDYVTRVS